LLRPPRRIVLRTVGIRIGFADKTIQLLVPSWPGRELIIRLHLTTNLPFSEWTSVFPNPRLCKALLDRITDCAHIIETGTESFRFRRTMERRKKGLAGAPKQRGEADE